VDHRIPYWLDDDGEANGGEAPEGSETLWSQPITGTSFATPLVTKAAMQIAHFLERMEQDLLATKGPAPTGFFHFAQVYETHGPARDTRLTAERLVGDLDIGAEGGALGSYPVRADPLVIKQILMDMAFDMPAYEPHEIGAGFVHPAIADHYFQTFGTPEIRSTLQWDSTGLRGADDDR
jgi:hypothetical protein